MSNHFVPYGRQIVEQITDDVTETLIIRNFDGLPVALAALDRNIQALLDFDHRTCLKNSSRAL